MLSGSPWPSLSASRYQTVAAQVVAPSPVLLVLVPVSGSLLLLLLLASPLLPVLLLAAPLLLVAAKSGGGVSRKHAAVSSKRSASRPEACIVTTRQGIADHNTWSSLSMMTVAARRNFARA
jgi:hypothetical protein